MASNEEHSTLDIPAFTPPPSVLIVVAPYYRAIADNLIVGAKGVLERANASVDMVEVPGALEVPTAIRLATRHYEGFVALGCVIRGETTHYDTVCNDSSRGLTLLGLDGLCIGNGILTCETMDQAIARAAPEEMDKGGGAAAAALHLISLARRFKARQDHPALPGSSDDILLAGDAGSTRTA